MARLSVSAEDHFALIDISGPQDDLLPHVNDMELVAATGELLRGHWEFLWDLRGLGETVYNDTVDAFHAAWSDGPLQREDWRAPARSGVTLLVPPGRTEEVKTAFRPVDVTPVEMLPKPMPRQDVDLEPFREGASRTPLQVELAAQAGRVSPDLILQAVAGDDTTWSGAVRDLAKKRWFAELAREDYEDASQIAQQVYALDAALRSSTTRSVLTELALHSTGGRIHVTPYHGEGLHETITERDDSVLLRPSRVNRQYWATFRAAIQELEILVNEPRVAERDIEDLLRRNPLFLNSLGYENVYHQVVLPRPGASDLRPDIIASPAASHWAEIIDLKRPSASLVVGRRDRAALSHALTEAVAQLREYAAYFDDRVAAARIEQALGIKCYRPKLTVVIGRDPVRFSDEERRRALTAHPDLRVVTYDDLLRAARTRFLL